MLEIRCAACPPESPRHDSWRTFLCPAGLAEAQTRTGLLILSPCLDCGSSLLTVYGPAEELGALSDLIQAGRVQPEAIELREGEPPPLPAPPPTPEPEAPPPPPELTEEDRAALDAATAVLRRHGIAYQSLFGKSWKLMETIDQAALGIERQKERPDG